MKTFATALALAAALAVPAIAQETTAPKSDPATVEGTTNFSGQISASELLNENVVNDANEKVGDINDSLSTAKARLPL